MSKGSEKKATDFQDLEMFVKACIQSANDFLESARLLEEKRKYRIAYRLAVLALEEVGKSILKIIDFGIPRKDNERSLLEKHSDDHIKKLFWALCTAFLTLDDFTIDEVRKYRELSSRIYSKSLEGFYVDIAATNVKELRPRISKGETKRIMSIAEARIKIQELRKLYQCKPKESRNIEWFLTAAEDEENAKLLFGRKSREKLKEINDVREWISWLKKQFMKAERENEELLKKELARKPSEGEDAFKQKWKFRIRLGTDSHSIRRDELSKCNRGIERIKLYPGKKNELIAEFYLPKGIMGKDLWENAFGLSQAFAVALNIATTGFFWWQIPKDLSRFYEKAEDIENNAPIIVERKQILGVNWGRKKILKKTQIFDSYFVLQHLLSSSDGREREVFTNYIKGLALLGKSDIYYQFYNEVFMSFFRALKSGMRLYNDFKGSESFMKAVNRSFSKWQKETYRPIIRNGIEFEKKGNLSLAISPEQVGIMKIMCDYYFSIALRRICKREKKTAEGLPT